MSIMTLAVAIVFWNTQDGIWGQDGIWDSNCKWLGVLGLFLLGGWLWIYGIAIQWLFLSKLSKQRWVLPLVLGAIIGLPFLVLIVLGHDTGDSFLRLFVFGTSPFLMLDGDLLPIAVSILLGQTLIIVMSLRLFTRQLKRAGQSELKQLIDRPAIAANRSTSASR
jgi:hypothetical protein